MFQVWHSQIIETQYIDQESRKSCDFTHRQSKEWTGFHLVVNVS